MKVTWRQSQALLEPGVKITNVLFYVMIISLCTKKNLKLANTDLTSGLLTREFYPLGGLLNVIIHWKPLGLLAVLHTVFQA